MQGSVIVESVLSRAVSDADLVIEAVVEDVEIKNSLFRGARLLLYTHNDNNNDYKLPSSCTLACIQGNSEQVVLQLPLIMCCRYLILVFRGDYSLH